MASTIGVMQATISVFLDDNDEIRSINAGKTRITFLLRQPLYYVCMSSGPLTFSLNVVAKNHPFSGFLSATESGFFVRKDNDLSFFPKIRPENDNDPKMAKICPENSNDLKM
jgi:hypothetical protein